MKKWEYRIIDTKEVPGGRIFEDKGQQAIEAYLHELVVRLGDSPR